MPNSTYPLYYGSEFEILGTPADTAYSKLSDDKGRYGVNPAFETNGGFRTGTVRNAAYTKPYMHNGVFTTLEQVVDFYNKGGGAGLGYKVDNQTLASDKLNLSKKECDELVSFIKSLDSKMN